MSRVILRLVGRKLAVGIVGMSLALSASLAIAGDALPALKAGDDNRRCYVAEVPADIVLARLTSETLPKEGTPVAPLLLSLGRYVTDKTSGETSLIFGLSAKSAGGPFTLMTGGGCATAGADDGTVNCIGDCIGGAFDVTLSADARRATVRPAGGAFQFVTTEGAPPGSCNLAQGGIAAYAVFSASGAAELSFAETDPKACLPMVEPLELKGVE